MTRLGGRSGSGLGFGAPLFLWLNMTTPSQPGKQTASGHRPVLAKFNQRLIGAISQSPLLRIRVSKTGRLLDCWRLEQVTPGLSNELLEAVLDGAEPVSVQLDLRALKGSNKPAEAELFGEHEPLRFCWG